jgi:hypothetical protein
MLSRSACVASTSGPPTPPQRRPRRGSGGGGDARRGNSGSSGTATPVGKPAAAPSPARSVPDPPLRSPLPPGGGSVTDRVVAAQAGVRRARGPAAPGAGAAGSTDGGGHGASAAGGMPRAAHSVEGCATEFVAETLLPTRQGKFRLRGYRHTVSVFSFSLSWGRAVAQSVWKMDWREGRRRAWRPDAKPSKGCCRSVFGPSRRA